jgi:hypothetical protein
MKSKHHGICSLTLSLLAVGLVGGYAYSGAWQKELRRPGPGRIPVVDVKVPSRAQVRSMQRLMAKLTALATPRTRAAPPLSMALFGHRAAPMAGKAGQDLNSREGQHHLSATLLTGATRFCIIDGLFTAQGTQLPDGAVLTRIESRRVQLVKQGRATWVDLEEKIADTGPAACPLQKGPS